METNYIKRLQNANRTQAEELAQLRQGLQDLRVYLTSRKFWDDPTVQVQDVLNRLDEAEQRTVQQD